MLRIRGYHRNDRIAKDVKVPLVYLGIILVCIANTIALGGPPQTATIPIQPVAISSLAEAERSSFALAILDARDRDLANFKYRTDERHESVMLRDGARHFTYHTEYEVRRVGNKLWVHQREYHNYPKSDDVRMDNITNWGDGASRQIAMPPYFGEKFPIGSILAKENPIFVDIKIDELLGFRVWTLSRKSLSVAQYVRDAAVDPKRYKLTISDEERNGAQSIAIRIRHLTSRGDDLFRLDPARNYMMIEAEHNLYAGRNGEIRCNWHSEVSESMQIGSVWVPRKIMFHSSDTLHADKQSEVTYDIVNFELGNVHDSDVSIEFPVGSKVLDQINNACYFIEPGGKYKLVSLADAQAKAVLIPPKGAAVIGRPQDAAKVYRKYDQAIPRAVARADPSRTREIVIWTFGGLFPLAIILYAILRQYRRRPAN